MLSDINYDLYGKGFSDLPLFFKQISKFVVASLIAFVLLGIVGTVLPTTKEASLIYVLPKVANSRTIKEISGLGVDTVKLLRGYVADLQESAKKPTLKEHSEEELEANEAP
jgi:hypothetical protein